MMNLMDYFKVKNNLLVGKDAFVTGDLFVSGKIISGSSIILDGGNPLNTQSADDLHVS